MSNGPRKLILINAGKYDYAEVDLEGALQIVGPNNTGKTTLINTLQFLYLNDQREMDFGAYTKEQTRDFYFRSQYSYVLFECLSSRGSCVFGWRGTSRTAGGDPERFLYFGPFDAADFFDDKGAVREPRDINARLALKQYETIKTQQQHRELLLNATAGNDSGLGIISLRDADKYPHFRETLKNLLSLSTITQEQMKERLLMMADIRPEEVALDARQMFGDDYDRIRSQRESLIRFKSRVDAIRALVANHAELQKLRSEAVYRWTDLRRQREQFELEHKCTVDSLRSDVATAEEKARLADEELLDRRKDEAAHHEAKGGWDAQLRALKKEKEGFRDFVEELERVAVRELERETHRLHQSILEGEAETREKAEQKVQLFSEQVRDRENTLRNADRLIVTALRKRFKDQDLDRAFSILNFNLLELPMGADGVEVLSESALSRRLSDVLQGAGPEGYADAAVKLRYPASRRSVADLGDPKVIGEQLLEYQSSLNRWRGILQSIQQREKLQAELQSKRDLLEAKRRELIRWEEYSKRKADEPRLLAELEKLQEALTQTASRIRLLVEASHTQSEQARKSRDAIRDAENSFNAVMGRFNQCRFPETSASPLASLEIPENFDTAIALFLRLQEREEKLTTETSNSLRSLEGALGDEFAGRDDTETIQNLADQLEALPEREEALSRHWNAHIHELKGSLDAVIKELNEIHSAADQLNRQLSRIQISNLKSLRIEAREQSDVVSRIRRLAEMEQPSLFDEQPQLESTLSAFRERLQLNPLIKFRDLFALQFNVVGDDDTTRHYQEFRQIESHGTTITIKVLFNLLILKSQLRKDDSVVPFFLDEIQALDPANRHAILSTAKKLGFIAITAAPESVTEVDALYFLQPHRGRVVLRHKHRLSVRLAAAAAN